VRAKLTAYAGAQLRNYLGGRAVMTVIATGLAAWAYGVTHGLTWSAFDASGGIVAREQLQRAFDFVLTAFAFLAAALAAHGLVAKHRRRGYDRVLFSRPLSPARYYAQGFVLAGLGAVVLGTIAAELYAVAVHPVSVAGAAAYVALGWLTIGGLAFLLSTVTVFHAPLLLLILAADLSLDRYVTAVRASGGGSSGSVLDIAQYVLPPGHVVALLSGSFARGVIADPRALVWPIAFGVACIVTALLLLRRRPFGS
jgi:ABC-type transport system involved in multi-copper enzyme maturation permease subunit